MFSKKWKFTLNGNKGTAGADAVSAIQQMASVWLSELERSLLSDKQQLVIGVVTMLRAAGKSNSAVKAFLDSGDSMQMDKLVEGIAVALGYFQPVAADAAEHEAAAVYLLLEMLSIDAVFGHKAKDVRIRKYHEQLDLYGGVTNEDGSGFDSGGSFFDDHTDPAKSYLCFNQFNRG